MGAFLACLLLVSGAAFAQEPLLVGVDNKDWAGHYEWKGDVLVGLDPDIVRAVAAKLGWLVQFKPFPWKRVLRMAQDHEIDCVLDLAPTKEREKFLHYVWTPLTRESTAFWVKKGNKRAFDGKFTPDMRLGLMFGADWSDRFAKQGKPTVKRFTSYHVAFDNLVAGNIDMFGSYLAPTRYHAVQHGFLGKVEPLDLKYDGLPYFLAFTTKDGHAELANRFDKELKAFYKSPQYKRLLRKHNAVDLVGDIH